MLAKTIMVQGTASNVGKSVVATALCRILKRRGYRVAPFKAQNMANNASVTWEGGEIGTAQAVQARACGIKPSIRMNPVLLKPNSDTTSQVVILGKVAATLTTKEYQLKKPELVKYVHDALHQLREEFDIVVIEGAGSPAEINLKSYDIVNMNLAKAVCAPVILVADIERGGIFAQIKGTFDLLEPEEKQLLKAFVINKFRGDRDILRPGIAWLEEKMQRKALGVIPVITGLNIQQEDAVVLDDHKESVGHMKRDPEKILIQVIRLPRISNFTDFEPLARQKDVILEYIDRPDRHCRPDLLIIPGTKNTVADLHFLRASRLDEYIHQCHKAAVGILGICGGYQMLGSTITEAPAENASARIQGLGLLPVATTFHPDKTTRRVKAVHEMSQSCLEGYEIHMGQTQALLTQAPFFKIVERQGLKSLDDDGYFVATKDIQGKGSFVAGTYIHGLFDDSSFRRYFLNQLRAAAGMLALSDDEEPSSAVEENRQFDRLADEIEKNMDMSLLGDILGEQWV